MIGDSIIEWKRRVKETDLTKEQLKMDPECIELQSERKKRQELRSKLKLETIYVAKESCWHFEGHYN